MGFLRAIWERMTVDTTMGTARRLLLKQESFSEGDIRVMRWYPVLEGSLRFSLTAASLPFILVNLRDLEAFAFSSSMTILKRLVVRTSSKECGDCANFNGLSLGIRIGSYLVLVIILVRLALDSSVKIMSRATFPLASSSSTGLI